MKWILRWTFRLFIALVVLVIACVLLRDTIAREFAEYQITSQTGLETRIGKISVGLFAPVVRIENLVIYNNADFGGGPLIEMPELMVQYDRDALRAGRLHCKLVRFNLSQVNVVEDKNGRRNIDLLQKRTQPKIVLSANPAARKNQAGKYTTEIDFAGIDTLNLTLGKATYLRMKQPGQVAELKLNVNHQVFTNIKSGQDFSGVLLAAMLRSGVNLMQPGNSPNWLQFLAPVPKSSP